MKEIEQKLYLLSLAKRLTADKAKALYANSTLTAEQYIELIELINNSTSEEVEQKINEQKQLVKVIEEKNEADRILREAKREEAAARRREVAEKAKNVRVEVSPEKKKKLKKYGILGAIAIVVLCAIIGIGNFLFTNYIGFTDVNLADYAIFEYDTDNYSAIPTLEGSWEYYNESNYYDDLKNRLVESGIYTQEQAEKIAPTNPITPKVGDIVTGYTLSTENPVKNGDQIEATITYDENLAKHNKIKVTNNVVKFTITGLQELPTTADITQEMVDSLGLTEEDAIAKVKDNDWDPEDYNYSINASKVYLNTYKYVGSDSEDPVVVDGDEQYATLYVGYEVKSVDKEDKSEVDYATVYKSARVYKNPTKTWLGDSYDTNLTLYKADEAIANRVNDYDESNQFEEVKLNGESA